MRYALIGGSGGIGTALSAHLQAAGGAVIVLSRSTPPRGDFSFPPKNPDEPALATEQWGCYPDDLNAAIEAADVIINLAGQSVLTTPWNKAGKLAIINSRVEPAIAAATALLRLSPSAPKTYLQASGISIYGSSPKLKDENAASAGHDAGFLSHVCRSWEAPAAALSQRAQHGGLPLRIATVRIGMVLGPSAGAEQQLRRMARLKLAGSLEHNNQWQSAITMTDLCHLLTWLAETKTASGIYNGVAPEAITMAELYPPLRQRFGWQLPFTPPSRLVGLALGAKAELVQQQFRLLPGKALAEGFRFSCQRPSHEFLSCSATT